MAKYELEIITAHGNKFRDGGDILQGARVKACRWAEKENATVMVRQNMGNGIWREIERIWYEPSVESNSWAYTNFKGGYWIQIYPRNGKTSKRCRVSPKTGRLLDISKEYRYL